MQFTPHQVIELFRAMYDWDEIGVADGEVVQRAVSPQVRRLLDSMGMFGFMSDAWQCHSELITVHKPRLTRLKKFFQACADALPSED